MLFDSLTLQWPWDDLKVTLEFYLSKAQHQPMVTFLSKPKLMI